MNQNNESGDLLKTFIEYFSILIGMVAGVFGSMENIDLLLGIILKITSIISFFIFLLINRSKIIEEIKNIRKK